METNNRSNAWIPWAFVLLWSTGFIGAKLGLPFIGPFTFLAIRMGLTLLCFGALIACFRPAWPGLAAAKHQWACGAMLHGLYLGASFAGIKLAVPAGITALIVGLQPILTAVLSWLMGEQRLSRMQWLGLAIGFGGALLVVLGGKGLPLGANPGLWLTVLALCAITAGTLCQKRFGQGVNPLTGAFHQYLAAFLITGVLALGLERGDAIHWNVQLALALGWSVLALSVLAILLLMRMLKDGEVSKVASYFYLTPGLAAVQAWWLFDEQLSLLAVVGMLLAALGVALVLQRLRWRR
ncbi:DMT family transporter [Chromobacterium haemolyticum]|uniref:DMT family transporter n=1 Tax=Chromobacterium haemolyticum TaxID=394935 RepID=UPI0002FEA218|nr:DMT family transporter [Chromobacterium haemolyticum]